MHCLGAGSGGQVSPSSFGSQGSVLSVVRALGVLVCEGRIQGAPRGYKEGPHCVPPLQSAPNNHDCEKDNYSCDRYLVLVREITERVAIGSYLCVEVVLCSDCPCGLVKANSKHRVLSVPLTSWQHSSEMLLEYWCIGIVPSKSPETMNSQGLYQAVRSRLHFSQVAAWWSRTAGKRPSHIATRIVQPSLGDEHLRRFREQPLEHIFPLAGLGDGNSVKVTMWALPRMEDIPSLSCPLHPGETELVSEPSVSVGSTTCTVPASKVTQPSDGGSTSCSPTSTMTTSPDYNTIVDGLVMPALLDDRLQIPCDKPGKHHCSCADEEDDDVVVTTAAAVRPNGERKRRRSLPCRPQPEPSTSSSPDFPPLPALKESTTTSTMTSSSSSSSTITTTTTTTTTSTTTSGSSSSVPAGSASSSLGSGESNGLESLERSFRTQLSIEEQQECCGNLEKRYKRSESTGSKKQQREDTSPPSSDNNTHVPLVIPWISYSANGKAVSAGLTAKQQHRNTMNLVLNPFCTERAREKIAQAAEQQSRREQAKLKSGSVLQSTGLGKTSAVRLDDWKKVGPNTVPPLSCSNNRDLNQLMSKLSFSQGKESIEAEQGGLLDWISRVPGRVLGSSNNSNSNVTEIANGKQTTTVVQQATVTQQPKCEVKIRNCNLELSPREFDEVLAVLRARTPLGRRRTGLRTAKRREKYDRLVNETMTHQPQQNAKAKLATATTDGSLCSNVSNKADVLLGAILRSTSKESNNKKNSVDMSNGTKTVLSTKEETETTTMKPSTSTTTNDYCPESSGDLISPAFKRLSRLRQLFKRDQDGTRLTASESNGYSQKHHQCKRRIDFSDEQENEDEDEEEDDDEQEDEDGDSDETHCYSSVGTSTNSTHVNTIFHSTNSEKRSGGCSPEPSSELGADQQRQRMECCMDVRTTLGKKKSRGKRDLSPIWVNHNNNHVSASGKANSSNSNANENGVTLEEESGETAIDRTVVPSAKDQERFRRSLENAASMVFHSRTGLPLTSSPAPLRRGSCCFDFDSSLNSVSSKRSALFELNTPPSPGAVSLEEGDRETENACDIEEVTRRRSTSRNRPQSHALLGSFEESALNGRLEPVSTVHGFTAEIGASGSFCPKHRKLPVTVFFYTLGDNDKVSSPYLAHINLGKKGYQVPRMGTIQVTLSNPLGTVVKMFVVLYDLSDMPARSHTFLRQRTLRDKTLRYLIHLRFMSGKSGRIYLHTDVRMIICRKSDVDTASDFGSEPPKELRSYIHGPTNPKFSPRC